MIELAADRVQRKQGGGGEDHTDAGRGVGRPRPHRQLHVPRHSQHRPHTGAKTNAQIEFQFKCMVLLALPCLLCTGSVEALCL